MKKLFMIVMIIGFTMMTVSPINAGPYYRHHHPRHHSGHHDSWAVWAIGALTGAVVASLFFMPTIAEESCQPPPAPVAPPPPVPPAMSPDVVMPPSTGIRRVSVEIYALNVRSGPGLHYPIENYVCQGDILAIYHHAPGWLYVQLPSGQLGWVMSEFTAPIPASADR